MSLDERFINAVHDYRYLLSRGFPRRSSLDLVSTRYSLSVVERMVLYRCVHPSSEARLREAKRVKPSSVRGEELVVDGYNVLITVDTALRGLPVFLSDDGFLRDVRKAMGGFTPKLNVVAVLALVALEVKELEPRKVTFLYDKQVSRSGELSAITRLILDKLSIPGTARTAERGDVEVLSLGGITCSSDVVVLDRADKLLDLAQLVVNKYRPDSIIDIRAL